MNDFANYLEKGGVIFSLLLIMSAIGLTIIIYKFFELYLLNKNNYKQLDFFLKENSSISQFKENLQSFSDNHVLKEIIDVLLNKNSDALKNDQILILVDKETEKMQRFMPTLEIIAQVSPLIGLLGTVIGMIDSFNELELGGSLVDPSILEEFGQHY